LYYNQIEPTIIIRSNLKATQIYAKVVVEKKEKTDKCPFFTISENETIVLLPNFPEAIIL